MNQAWIQLRAQKQFITTASDFLFYALIYRNAQRVKYSGQMQKILFFCFCLSHIQKKNGVFTGYWRNFFIFAQKIAIRLHFLKSYSFAINNI